jgi:uncharacterized protein YgiM (DUF1202 family)
MKKILAMVGVIFLCVSAAAYGKSRIYNVVIADPYIEMHTGPGQGYPIFHVEDRGGTIEVIKRHTDWFKVETENGKRGWVASEQLARTLQTDGTPTEIKNMTRDDFLERRWEMGMQIGDFGGANIISGYGAYHFTENISAELWASHINGDFSDGWMVNANVVHQPFPTWIVSPFFTLGTGVLHIQPKATLVQTQDRTDQEVHAGFGLRSHISRQFLLRAEYKSYVVFTNRDDNEEVNEWTVGFSFFF